MRSLTTVFALFATLLTTAACGNSDDKISETASPAPAPTEQTAPTDPAEQVCVSLGTTAGNITNIAIIGSDPDSYGAWAQTTYDIAYDAKPSTDDQIKQAATAITTYMEDGDGAFSPIELHPLARDLAQACADAGHIPSWWITLPAPDTATMQQFVFSAALAGTGDDDTLAAGLAICDHLAAAYNKTGEPFTFDAWTTTVGRIAAEMEMEPVDAISISTAAGTLLCPDPFKPWLEAMTG